LAASGSFRWLGATTVNGSGSQSHNQWCKVVVNEEKRRKKKKIVAIKASQKKIIVVMKIVQTNNCNNENT